MHRNFWVPGLLIVLVCVGWTVAWFVLADRIITELQVRRADLERQGFVVGCASESTGGFPFRLTRLCEGARVSLPDGSTFTAPALQANAVVYLPDRVIVAFKAPGEWIGPDGSTVNANWTLARFSVHFGASDLPLLSSEADGLAARWSAHGRTLIEANAGHAELHTRPDPTDASRLDLAASGSKLAVSINGRPLLPKPIDFALDTAVKPARDGNGNPVAPGSSVQIKSSSLAMETARLAATGDLAADPAGILNGKLELTISPVTALANFMRGTPAESSAQAATALLAIIGKPVEGDTSARTLPLDITQGRVGFRNFQFMQVPPVK